MPTDTCSVMPFQVYCWGHPACTGCKPGAAGLRHNRTRSPRDALDARGHSLHADPDLARAVWGWLLRRGADEDDHKARECHAFWSVVRCLLAQHHVVIVLSLQGFKNLVKLVCCDVQRPQEVGCKLKRLRG
jgi:hypothetical protein